MHQQQKCSTSNRNMGARGYVSIQIKVAEADQVTGRFHQQFKTYTVCGALCRMGESDDSILLLAKADGILSKNF
ncbi:unnamed protein product [Nyctereutes procyonoides]|uniref:(raccoon dog) hypothetical protein n=2 Tax=Nyctereutes procyonoides TaxID=34880 RepID=A0A811Y755_NYCPR|nr:unnamed protein product [Nyctereutes procyonoides]